MPEPNGAPDWLDQAERDAKAMIERLYTEGRSALSDDPAASPATPTAPPVAAPSAPVAAPPEAVAADSTAAAVLAAAAAAEPEPPGARPTWPDPGSAHRRVDGTEPR